MKKLIKTMAAVTAAVLTLSFVACSYDGANLGANNSKDGPNRDVEKYADGLKSKGDNSSNGEENNNEDDDDDDDSDSDK